MSLPSGRGKKFLIGLTGTNGAGKGEVAAFFRKKGFDYFSLSDLIREELILRGQEIDRNSLIREGNRLRGKFGPDILARRLYRRIKRIAVIDSIRNPREVEYFKKKGPFVLLAVDAPVAIRYDRVKQRGRDESAASLEQFRQKEAEEMSGKKNGQQLSTCMRMADFVILNDGTLQALNQRLEEWLWTQKEYQKMSIT